jgi:hypothetical protein
MALAQSIKAPKKAPPKKRDPAFSDEKYTGTEPVWDTERAAAMSQDEFDHFLRKSFFYYNYYYSQKDCKRHVVKWMQDNQYSKADVSKFVRSPDRALPMTACALVMAALQGMPMREKELTYLRERLHEAVNSDNLEPEEVVDTAKPVQQAVRAPTIQDRLNEKTAEHLAHFEGLYDEVLAGDTVKPDAFNYLTANTVPQSQIGKFEHLFTVRKGELLVAQERRDEQVEEAYRHYKAADFRRHHAFLDQLLTDLDQYRSVKKTQKKARVKRAPNKEKVVSRLKYMKEEKTLKLVSINPVDIVGASSLWVYNTKTRKMGVYRADSLTGPLGVKGTTITNFDEFKSIQKTIRKPEEKLKEFKAAGKVQLRKFLDDINATDTKMNGRINEETILLKVA